MSSASTPNPKSPLTMGGVGSNKAAFIIASTFSPFLKFNHELIPLNKPPISPGPEGFGPGFGPGKIFCRRGAPRRVFVKAFMGARASLVTKPTILPVTPVIVLIIKLNPVLIAVNTFMASPIPLRTLSLISSTGRVWEKK